jgi:parallel beta-helix repeat protein
MRKRFAIPYLAGRGTASVTVLILMACFSGAEPIVPVDGQVFTSSATFVPGTYSLPNGVSVGAPGVTLDMNGATLVGAGFEKYGVSCVGFDKAVIKNGTIRGYYYGVRVQDGSGAQVLSCNLSANWVDPASLTSSAPFLDINAGPDLSDRTNLGGGLFMNNVSGAVVSDNVMRNQENGIDLYNVTNSIVQRNDASQDTGWGIHLYASTGNTVQNNTADECTRTGLGDSAGILLVDGSSSNQIIGNSFQHSGDGFFIGNENGCPSNNNLVQGNNGSYAGANAFEATFSSGNQFIGNVANGSNYGFWLGYSHDGNVIRGNTIRANSTSGIEIEHGQYNTIEDNEIVGNGGSGIVLRTDGLPHITPNTGCLNLPDPASSSHYTIRNNRIYGNFGAAMVLTATTDSLIVNNLFGGPYAGTVTSDGANNVWSVAPTPGTNIVGGATLGGNWWYGYSGADTDGDGLGDTSVPYTNGGQVAAPGDPHPLIGTPDLGSLSNPRTLWGWQWTDLGRNTRSTGDAFDTANGTHFATNGTDLYLLEGANSPRLSLFDPATNRYVAKADAPEGVEDGGDFQYGAGLYYANVGLGLDAATGEGNGSRLYAYNPNADSWSEKAPASIGGNLVGKEALAFDSVGSRLYATIARVKDSANGGDVGLLSKLAIYDPASDTWTGTTSAAPDAWGPGSEAEYLDGHIYVYRGAGAGQSVNGSDSYLDVYDTKTDTWTVSPTLQASGVAPGFCCGGLDCWGVSLSADAVRRRVFVMGAESNHVLYVFDVATQTWAAGPAAPYDSGWGASIEYVAASDRVYQIDGRNIGGTAQGTAYLYRTPFVLADAARALGAAAGLLPGVPSDAKLNVEGSGTAVDIHDALRIARKVAGLEANP